MEIIQPKAWNKFSKFEQYTPVSENHRFLSDKDPKPETREVFKEFKSDETLIKVKEEQIKLLQKAKQLHSKDQDHEDSIIRHYEILLQIEQVQLNRLKGIKSYPLAMTYNNDLEDFNEHLKKRQQQVDLLGVSKNLFERVRTFSLAETYFMDEQFKLSEIRFETLALVFSNSNEAICFAFDKEALMNYPDAIFSSAIRDKRFFSVEAALHALIVLYRNQPLNLEYLAVKKVLENISWVSWNEIQFELGKKYQDKQDTKYVLMDFLSTYFGGAGLFREQYHALKMILKEYFLHSSFIPNRRALHEKLGWMMVKLLERSNEQFLSLGLPLKFQKELFNGYIHKYDEVMKFLSPDGRRKLNLVRDYFKNYQNVLDREENTNWFARAGDFAVLDEEDNWWIADGDLGEEVAVMEMME